jgi:uroporphyrinogen-III synthase
VLLLTRPNQQSTEMGSTLKEMGVPFFIEPMLSVTPLKKVSLKGYQTLIITSHNALDMLQNFPPNMDIYCVGESLSDALKEKGALSVCSFDTVLTLVEHIKTYPPSHFRAILYGAGVSKTIDIQSILSPLGYTIKTENLYQTSTPAAFSNHLLAFLEKGIITHVSFFSQKTAEAFISLAQMHKIENACVLLTAISFSPNISSTLKNLPWQKVLTTQRPSMNSFWQVVKNHVR